MMGRVSDFARAVARRTLAGCPNRTEAESQRIAAICKACEHLVNGRCDQCKCNIRMDDCCLSVERFVSTRMIDKIRMATEDCPVTCKCGKSKWYCQCSLLVHDPSNTGGVQDALATDKPHDQA